MCLWAVICRSLYNHYWVSLRPFTGLFTVTTVSLGLWVLIRRSLYHHYWVSLRRFTGLFMVDVCISVFEAVYMSLYLFKVMTVKLEGDVLLSLKEMS